jgi:hypothetical protein
VYSFILLLELYGACSIWNTTGHWRNSKRSDGSTGRKSCPTTTFPPHISRGMLRDRNRISLGKGRQLTTWATTLPKFYSSTNNLHKTSTVIHQKISSEALSNILKKKKLKLCLFFHTKWILLLHYYLQQDAKIWQVSFKQVFFKFNVTNMFISVVLYGM